MHMHYVNISELINDKDLRVLLIFRLKQYVVGISQIRLGKSISIIVNNNYSTQYCKNRNHFISIQYQTLRYSIVLPVFSLKSGTGIFP